ncbi:hypothetical protein JVX93_31640 [Mycolicibacterium boenickei]|nr:hypothetical protein JVX93_31640 [Mycolicibacterium boenickei]
MTPGISPKAPNAPPAAKPTDVPCAGQSFTPDTRVLLADGTNQPISQLGVGDLVWSTDPVSGQSGPQTVQAVLVNHDTDLLDLTITNAAGASSVINTTNAHPFYSPSRAHNTVSALAATTTPTQAYGPGWTDAQDLRPGDALYTPNGAVAQVKSTTPVAGDADMWDLTIETTHTFYISTEAGPVLVHNCPVGPDLPVPAGTKPPKATGEDIAPKTKDEITADRVAKSPDGNLRCENPHCAQRVFRQEGKTVRGDKIPPNRAQFDHKDTPKSQGGTGGENGEDTQILCARCNGPAGKSDKSPEEWAAVQEDVGRDSRRIIQEYVRQHGEPPDGVIHSPNLRPQAAARNDQAQDATKASATEQRDTAASRARDSNDAKSGDKASTTGKSRDSGKKKDGEKKADKKKDKKKKKKDKKKKNKKSKKHHNKPK